MNLKERGFTGLRKWLFYGIAAAIGLMTFVIPGNAMYVAPQGNKIIGIGCLIVSCVAFFLGSDVFEGEDPDTWKWYHWLWVLFVAVFAIIGFTVLVAHGGPLGLNGKTV